jgi:hypothetical protein
MRIAMDVRPNAQDESEPKTPMNFWKPVSLLTALLVHLPCLLTFSSSAGIVSANSVVTPPGLPLQIVTCREDVDLDALIAEFKFTPKFKYPFINGFAAPMDAATILQLKADGRILYVEADGPVTLCGQRHSSELVRMGVDRFPLAHINHTNEPLGVDVAILDSGIDPHPDMDPIPDDHTFITFGNDGRDSLGHGTGVAGVVAARDNTFGVVGVAPGVRIWNVKVIGPPPDNTVTHNLEGMNFVFEHADKISVANFEKRRVPRIPS